jgi:aconitase B
MMIMMIFMMVLLLLMMMIIGITLRDLVHAITYYAIQVGMRKMMMILTIYHQPISSNHDYLHLSTSIYHHIYKGLLTVEKKGKKNVFNGRILEIEGKKVDG